MKKRKLIIGVLLICWLLISCGSVHDKWHIENEMSESYLSTHGVAEYHSDYLTLRAIENIKYVPTVNSIHIYYEGRYCGKIFAAYFGSYGALGTHGDWTNDLGYVKGMLGSHATLYEEIDVDKLQDIPELVMLMHRSDPLFSGGSTLKWLLNNKYVQNENGLWDLNTNLYEAVYGVADAKYGYVMQLSTYFINTDMLGMLLEAVEFNEQSFSEQMYVAMSSPGDVEEIPESVLQSGKILKVPDNNGEGKEFRFFLQIGNSVWTVPTGTIALEDGSDWKLYALVGYSYSEIGGVKIYSGIETIEKAKSVLQEYLGEGYFSKWIDVTENGIEYNYSCEDGMVYSVYDKKAQEMMIAVYYPKQ